MTFKKCLSGLILIDSERPNIQNLNFDAAFFLSSDIIKKTVHCLGFRLTECLFLLIVSFKIDFI